MKTDCRYLAALLVLLMLGGGCKHTPVPLADLTPEAWLAQDAEACLRHYTRSFTRLSGEAGYDSVRRLYAGLMRRLPEHPAGDADSVAVYMGRLLTYYNNAAILLPPDSIDPERFCREGVALYDSLMRSSHRFYRDTLRPELLTLGAQLRMAANDYATADSMARALLALPVTENAMRAVRNYHIMAWTALYACANVDVAVRLQERAVAACRAGGTLGADGEVFSRMSYFCRVAGRYEEAVRYIQEAIDHYTAGMPGGLSSSGTAARGDCLPTEVFPVLRDADGRLTPLTRSRFTGLITAYGDFASLYALFGLYDRALEANRVALYFSHRADGLLLPELYRIRAAYFAAAKQADASLVWSDSAYAACLRSEPDRAVLNAIRTDRLYTLVEAYPDSAASCLAEARAFLADTTDISPKRRPGLYQLYGTMLLHTAGREAESAPYLEEAYRRYVAWGDPSHAESVADELLKAYARTGRYDKLGSLYPTYAALRDSLWREDRQRAVIAANIRYETERKEQENLLLATEVRLERRTLAFAWVLSGLLAVMLAGVLFYARHRRRYHRRVSEAHLARIGALLVSRQKLLEAQQELLEAHQALLGTQQELLEARRKLSVQNKSLSAELLKGSLHQDSADLRTQISTLVFDSDKEAAFRRSFTALYPRYLPALHRLYASLTRTDELIAMLLLLDLSNDEIALTLGISKASVNKARSRMRKRLELDAKVKLEDFLRGI